MERHSVILDDKFIIIFSNGAEIFVPWWTVEVAAITLGATVAAILIWTLVRLVNRRAKRPPDAA
jgi:hypothetical protein